MKQEVVNELKRIKAACAARVLLPADVVAAARSPRSPLHEYFEWDDSAAAELYRLRQAQQLIRVHVTTIPGTNVVTRAWVSLTTDRPTPTPGVHGGGGYRSIEEVLENPSWREQLLADALSELKSFQTKYALLTELKTVFAEIDALRLMTERRAKKKSNKKKATARKPRSVGV